MYILKLVSILSLILLVSCTAPTKNNREDILYKYAYSSCIFWYLNGKGYDVEDIRAISGGIVEKSDISLNKFQDISLFIKDYSPDIVTKGNIDKNINKCFVLNESKELGEIISK